MADKFTWQDARRVVAGHIARLKLPSDMTGMRVHLAEYLDEDTLRFMKADEPNISLKSQALLNQSFARELRKRGAKVDFVAVDVGDFFGWIGKYRLANTPANRAQYVSWLTCGEPKFEPRESPPFKT